MYAALLTLGVVLWLFFCHVMTRCVFGIRELDERNIEELRARNASRDATAERAREVPAIEGGSADFETRGA